MIAALYALLIPVAAAWLALPALRLRTPAQSATLTAVVAFACGVGLSSLTTFWLMAHAGLTGDAFVAADASLWTAAAALAWWRWRAVRRPWNVAAAATHAPAPWWRVARVGWPARALFAIVAALALATTCTEYAAAPHGQWDAWAVWNQKARFLIRAGEGWTSSLAISWSNPSHPLLVPTSVARLWSYAGAEMTAIPALLGATFGIGIVATVIGALDPRRARAWVAGSVVAAPAIFVQLVSAQTADLPTSFFIVSALIVVLNVRATEQPETAGARTDADLLLGAMLGGFAAWTKNEGLLLVVMLMLLAAWRTMRRARLGPLATAAAATAPALVSIAWLKIVVAPVPPGYFEGSGQGASFLDRLLSAERHEALASLVADASVRWGGPGAAGSLLVAAAAVGMGVLLGRRAAGAIAAIALVMFAGYYVSWLLSPLDMRWMIATSFDRLLIQLWPSMVVASFSPGRAEAPLAPAAAFASHPIAKDNPYLP